MNTLYGGLLFGSVVSSVSELRAAFPAGSSHNLLMLPYGTVPGADWPFPSTRLWSPPCSWDDLHFLLEAMSHESSWHDFETKKKEYALRDTCLVHHFHLESSRGKGPRSNYRWFAFRDPLRFGNVWFNLGGIYLSPEWLSPLWTSSTWMSRRIQLDPWVASTYYIRGNPGLPVPVASRLGVRHIWKDEENCYPVVKVGDYFYICAGGRASHLDLASLAVRGRWAVYVTSKVSFAQFLESEPENMLHQMQDASGIADRVDGKV